MTTNLTDLRDELTVTTQLIDAMESAASTTLTGIVASLIDKLAALKRHQADMLTEIRRIEDGIPF